MLLTETSSYRNFNLWLTSCVLFCGFFVSFFFFFILSYLEKSFHLAQGTKSKLALNRRCLTCIMHKSSILVRQ